MQEKDFKWFLDNYNDLFKQYGVSILAIKNGKVLGAYNSYGEAVRETKETEEPGTFIVQECNGNSSAYTNNIASLSFS